MARYSVVVKTPTAEHRWTTEAPELAKMWPLVEPFEVKGNSVHMSADYGDGFVEKDLYVFEGGVL